MRAEPGSKLSSGALRTLWSVAIVLGGLLTAWLTISVPQLSVAVAFVVVVGIGYRRSRHAALCCLWMLWLVMPFIRRLFGLIGPMPEYDPLSVLPFVATFGVALIELTRISVGVRLGRILLLAAAGIALGIPPAETRYAATTLYGLLAYGSALAACLIGYSEQQTRQGESSLVTVMLKAGPVLALYALYQYFAVLPVWDAHWIDSVQFESVWAPVAGHIRVFGTLNAPGTFAEMMAVAILVWVAEKRFTTSRLAGLGCLIAALALTYARSVWIGLVIGIITYLVAARRSATPRVLLVCALVALVGPVLAGSNPTVEALVSRLSSLLTLDADVSAQARIDLFRTIAFDAVSSPLGHGIGQAGIATKLGGETLLASADNGYLAILYQVGPAGFLLLLSSMVSAVVMAARGALLEGEPGEHAGFALALLVAFLVIEGAGDTMYGITGVAFWYVAGQAVAIVDASRRPVPADPRITVRDSFAPGYS